MEAEHLMIPQVTLGHTGIRVSRLAIGTDSRLTGATDLLDELRQPRRPLSHQKFCTPPILLSFRMKLESDVTIALITNVPRHF